MSTNVKNVVAGKPVSGGVWIAPLGTALPADEAATLDNAFIAAGYISEDGLTETVERATDKIRAWGGDLVKVVQSEFNVSYQFTFIESVKQSVLEAVYGSGNVTTTDATTSSGAKHAIKIVGDQLPHSAFVFDVKDGDAAIRIVVEDGQITEVGEVTYADGEAVGYQVTVEAFVGSTTSAQAVKYVNDGQKAAA